VRRHTTLPILIGSGATPDNLPQVYAQVDGLIVGSYFKQEGISANAGLMLMIWVMMTQIVA